MKKRMALLLCVPVLLLMGCNEKNVDYDIDDTQSTRNGAQIEGDSTLAQFADAEPWKESFEVAGEYTTTKITIDAQIEVPDVQSMSVIEVQEPKVDAYYREKIVKKLFGDSTIYLYDEANLPKAQLQEKIAEYQEQLTQLQDQQTKVGDGLADKNERDLLQQQVDECQQQIDSLEKNYATAPEVFIPADNYQSDAYLAYRDGNGYVLQFETGVEEGIQGVKRTLNITFSPLDIHELCPAEVKGSQQVYYTGAGVIDQTVDNFCTMTGEAAGNMSLGMLSDLGLSNLVQTDVYALGWYGYDGENSQEAFCIDGYEFMYQLGINQSSLADTGFYVSSFQPINGENKESEENTVYSENIRAEVSVTDDGVIGICLSNPVEVTSSTSEVKLLPLENIKEIMRNELMNHFFDYDIGQNRTMSFTKLSLVYLRVADDSRDGGYSYIPVWRLCYDEDGTYSNALLLNAIDGSVVYL